MSVASVTARGRKTAATRFLDTFAVKVQTGETYDEVADAVVPVFSNLFITLGRVKATGTQAHDAEAGGRTVVTVTRELHIPVGSPAVPAGALAVCTAVDVTSDPTLLGATLRLAGPAPGSQTTARRLQVEEILT